MPNILTISKYPYIPNFYQILCRALHVATASTRCKHLTPPLVSSVETYSRPSVKSFHGRNHIQSSPIITAPEKVPSVLSNAENKSPPILTVKTRETKQPKDHTKSRPHSCSDQKSFPPLPNPLFYSICHCLSHGCLLF